MAVSGGIVEAYGADFDAVTCKVAAAVTEGKLVEHVAAGTKRVQTAAVGSLIVAGVALQTASAVEDEIGVATEGFFYLTASGAIANGDSLEAAAAGDVRVLATVDAAGSLNPRAKIGRAYQAAANGARVLVKVAL